MPDPPAGPPAELPTLLARLRAAFPGASTRRLRRWLAEGRARVGGEVARDGRRPVDPGLPVTLGPPAPAPPPAGLRVLHEDDDVLVVDKPPGLLTVATERERERTLYRLAWAHLARRRPPRRPFIVHRLDRETSGVLVLATSPRAKTALQAQFAAGTVEREYRARVAGAVAAEAGVLRDRLVEDRSLRVRRLPPGGGRRPPGARLAVTRYRVLERGAGTTLLALALETGRRRQIRVQLAALGHPVVGDREPGAGGGPGGRLLLHATRLAFDHPRTGARVVVESPPPPALRPRPAPGAGGGSAPRERPRPAAVEWEARPAPRGRPRPPPGPRKEPRWTSPPSPGR
jgi:23S rRNA pseudouridine1911/1915/1917 synthase